MSFEHPLGRLMFRTDDYGRISYADRMDSRHMGYCDVIDHEEPTPIPAMHQIKHLTDGHVHLGAAPSGWHLPPGPDAPTSGWSVPRFPGDPRPTYSPANRRYHLRPDSPLKPMIKAGYHPGKMYSRKMKTNPAYAPWQGNLGMSSMDAGIAGAFVGSILVGTMAAGFVVDTLISNKLLGFQNRMKTGDMVKRSALVGAVFGTLLAAPYAFGTYWVVRSIPEE